MVWDWAADRLGFGELQDQLQRTFRDRFVLEEWSKTFNAIFDVSAPQSDDELLASPTDESLLRPGDSVAIRAVEDAMAAVGVSISTSWMYVLSSDSSNIRPPSPRTHCVTKRRKMGSSIFLDISASEDDEEEKEEEDEEEDAHSEVERSTLTQVQPAGRSHFSDTLEHLITRYEYRQPAAALGSPASSTLHETRLYKVDFPSSKYLFLVL